MTFLAVFTVITVLFVIGVRATTPTEPDDDTRPPTWHKRNTR